jgi:hypothetical protein
LLHGVGSVEHCRNPGAGQAVWWRLERVKGLRFARANVSHFEVNWQEFDLSEAKLFNAARPKTAKAATPADPSGDEKLGNKGY